MNMVEKIQRNSFVVSCLIAEIKQDKTKNMSTKWVSKGTERASPSTLKALSVDVVLNLWNLLSVQSTFIFLFGIFVFKYCRLNLTEISETLLDLALFFRLHFNYIAECMHWLVLF